MSEPLFTRGGTEFTGTVVYAGAAAIAGFYETPRCSRCGGAGGADQWKHTGWTCYDCGGSGKAATRFVKLYTADKLAKLNATADKREAKRLAKIAEKAAQQAVETAARQVEFEAAFGALLARTESLLPNNPTAMDIVNRARQRAALSAPQADLLTKMCDAEVARVAKVATTCHVAEVGARLNVPVTVVKVSNFERAPFNNSYARFTGYMETVWIVIMEDASGNQIVSKSPNFKEEVGEAFTLRATVKEHSVYRDVKQTVVNRAKRV